MAHARSPAWLPLHRWLQLVRDLEAFAAGHLDRAAGLGWTLKEMFGCPPDPAMRRVDLVGLVPLLCGRKVIEVTERCAVIASPSGAPTKFYRHAPGCSQPFNFSSASLVWDAYSREEAF